MKKSILFLLTLLLCVVLSACAKDDTSNTKDNTTHTLPPTQVASQEYEWAQIDCDITLVDGDSNVLVSAEDFETFAVVGTDDNAYIIIKVSDSKTNELNTLDSTDTLYLSINGELVPNVSIKSDTFSGQIEFGHDMEYNELCELATTIRGLFS